jgi:lipopolysaccharide/colanic/teichoic acid biosynthesis glycosyltransferase
MVKEAEKLTGPIQASENDYRVTKVGAILRALAMDELPQLLNILKGEISFVGPRALRFEEREVLDNSSRKVSEYPYFKERSKTKPGLTGVAQVFAPRDILRKDKFKYDAWYIKNQSFSLDLYLIILSFLITFRGKWELRKNRFHTLGRKLKEKIKS